MTKLAIDFGNVIGCANDGVGPDLPSKIAAYEIPDECIKGVSDIIGILGAENVFILSKCGPRMQQATVVCLGKNDFYERTGIPPDHTLFCRTHSGGTTKIDWAPVEEPGIGDFAGLGYYFVHGPLCTTDKATGKDAVGVSMGINSLIDDRLDCLLPFPSEEGVLLQATWFVDDVSMSAKSKIPRNLYRCRDWNDIIYRIRRL